MSKEAFNQRKNKFLSDGLENIARSLASIADNLLNVSTALSAQNEEELQRENSATSLQEFINGRVKALKETGGSTSKGKSSQGEKSKLSQAEEGADKQAPKRKRRNKRDGPAKPQNAFQFFCKKVYPVYKHEYPEEKYHGIVRIMGEQWRKMDDDAKRPYKDEFEEALSKWKSEFSNDQGKNEEDQGVVNGEPDDDGIADEKSVSGDTNASDKDYKGSSKNGSDFSDDEKGTPISITQKKNIEVSSDSSDDEYEDGSHDELISTERARSPQLSNISSTNTDAQKRKAFIDNKDTLSKRVKSSSLQNDPVAMSENTNKESISTPKGSLTKERKEKKYKDTTQTKPGKLSSTKAKVNDDGKTDRKRSNSVDENVMDVESASAKLIKKKKKSKHPANGNT